MGERNLLFIPMYNCAPQIPRVLDQLANGADAWFDEVLIVDNGSTDSSREAAAQALENRNWNLTCTLVQNAENYHLGGSHKVAFNYALDHGYDYVAVLHGDNQGRIDDLIVQLKEGRHRDIDCLLGSRFMPGSERVGYSLVRTVGNYVFNVLYSIVSARRLLDLGSGLNLYRVSCLEGRDYLRFPNRLTFNYYLLLYTVARRARIRFFPILWREEDQVSNLRLLSHIIEMLKILWQFMTNRERFMSAWHEPDRDYRCVLLKQCVPNPDVP